MKKIILKNSVLALTLVILLTACGSKEKYTIEFKPQKGAEYKQVALIDMKVKASEMFSANANMQMDMRYKVTDVQGDLTTMDVYTDYMKVTLASDKMNVTIDSNTTDTIATQDNLNPIAKAAVISPLTITSNKFGKIMSINGINTMVDNIVKVLPSSDNPMMAQQMAMLKMGLNDHSVNAMVTQIPASYPEQPVAVGEGWVVDVDGIKIDFKLKSVENDIATVDFSSNIKDTEYQGVKMNGTIKGTTLIDLAGVNAATMDMSLKIDGTSNMMNMQIPVNVEMNMSIK